MDTDQSNMRVGVIEHARQTCTMRARVNSTQLLAYFFILLTMLASLPQPARAYSFLSHEDMIDVAWHRSIRPLLLARFPTATAAQLHEARAYVYGGATIQDMGYYPFGHQFFSNLTHYVRSGEFVNNLLLDSQTVDEYAFALGALSHYIGDSDGHRYATNPSTPIEFPSLEKKYGPIVTYDQSPHGHVRTEFAYDIEQLGQHQFAPAGYLRSVGFKVPLRVLGQAFFDTYGLSLRSVLGRPGPASRSYRSSVQSFLPDIARAEVLIHRNDFPREADTPAFHQFLTRQKQAGLDNQWTQYRERSGLKLHLIAFFIVILPKIGPISNAAIRGPNAETNRWYIESMNRSVDDYERFMHGLTTNPRQRLDLPDRDLDTGNFVRPGSYRLTDKTYAQLLAKLTAQPNRTVPAGLQKNILDYYADPDAPNTTKKNANAWKRVQQELPVLRDMKVIGQSTATVDQIALRGTLSGNSIDAVASLTEQ